MDFLLTFIAGVIVGWLIKWAFDMLNAPKPTAETVAQPQLSGKIEAAEHQIEELENQLGEAKKAAAEVVLKEKDRLERIRGIGPVFANRLNEAGVHTFSDLAKMSPARVRDIISPQDWQAIDPPAWIDEARDIVMFADQNGGSAT